MVRLLWFWLDQFSQAKNKIPLLQKHVINKSASVIFELVKLIILSYNEQKKHIRRCEIIGLPYIQFIVMFTRYSVVQKVK